MKKILFLLFTTLLTVIVHGQTTPPEYWKQIKQPKVWKNGELNVSGLAINDKGVILAFGYTQEKIILNEFELELKFKIFRSRNNALTWEDISQTEFKAFNYYFNPIMGTYAPSVRPNCIFTAVGNNFYINFIGGYYVSEDDGTTWKKVVDPSTPDRTILFTINENTRVGLSTMWTAGFQYPNYSTYSKKGNVWEKVIDPGKKEYQIRRPIIIFKGNETTICNMITGDKFGGKDHPYYTNYGDNTEGGKRLIPCGQKDVDDISIGVWSSCRPVERIYRSAKSDQYLYTIAYYNSKPKLFRSNDKGKTFGYVDIPNIDEVRTIFPICDNGTLVVAVVRKGDSSTFGDLYLLGSFDHGNTWEPFGDYPKTATDALRTFIFMKDGRFLYGAASGLYLGVGKVGCGSGAVPEEEAPEYGTTVITHGYQMGGSPPFGKDDWTLGMANEIVKKAKNKGCIGLYDKKTGSFKLQFGKWSDEGEKVLIFDWASESNIDCKGYSEAAADALFASLISGSQKGQFNLTNIHFIGHSRGTVVNTLAVERLLALKNNYPQYAQINIDQVTNLDAHDWGFINIASDIDDAHPELNISMPQDHLKNNGTIAWKGVHFNDSYYQDNVQVFDLKGRRVQGADNYYWDQGTLENHVSHTGIYGLGIHEVYTSTINKYPKLIGGGYHFSRLSNGRESRNSSGGGQVSSSYNFYSRLINSNTNTNRIVGIMNGSFDRFQGLNLPGWEEHGGGMEYTNPPNTPTMSESAGGGAPLFSSISASNGGIELKFNYHSTKPMNLTHNRFYIPADAKNIGFQIKTKNLKEGILRIYIKGQGKEKMAYEQLNIGEIPNLISKTLNESTFKLYRDSVVTLRFEFSGNPLITAGLPMLAIDEVTLLSETATGSSLSSTYSTGSNPDVVKSQQNISVPSTGFSPTGIPNGAFDNNQGWTSSGGTVLFKNGEVSMKPEQNKVPVKIKSAKFQVPDTGRTINLKIDKHSVSSGDFKIVVTNDMTGVAETVYTDNIRETINKVNDGLGKVNGFLKTGNLQDFEKKKNFEVISVDVSKYAGKKIFIEFSYENFGVTKPKILIDEVVINN